jgi:hypothetical protein
MNNSSHLSVLVTSSFPRAELTSLSYKLEDLGGPLAVSIAACPTNRDRAALVLQHIKTGSPVLLIDPSDIAAVDCPVLEELLFGLTRRDFHPTGTTSLYCTVRVMLVVWVKPEGPVATTWMVEVPAGVMGAELPHAVTKVQRPPNRIASNSIWVRGCSLRER